MNNIIYLYAIGYFSVKHCLIISLSPFCEKLMLTSSSLFAFRFAVCALGWYCGSLCTSCLADVANRAIWDSSSDGDSCNGDPGLWPGLLLSP